MLHNGSSAVSWLLSFRTMPLLNCKISAAGVFAFGTKSISGPSGEVGWQAQENSVRRWHVSDRHAQAPHVTGLTLRHVDSQAL